MTENVGRALSSAEPPATASAMRISGLRLGGVLDADDDGVLARGAHAGVELVQDARLPRACPGPTRGAEVAERLGRPSTTRAAS